MKKQHHLRSAREGWKSGIKLLQDIRQKQAATVPAHICFDSRTPLPHAYHIAGLFTQAHHKVIFIEANTLELDGPQPASPAADATAHQPWSHSCEYQKGKHRKLYVQT